MLQFKKRFFGGEASRRRNFDYERSGRMNETTVRAYAKVNLTLEIVGRGDGYHQLDSLVASVDVYDSIHLKKRKGKLSSIWMHGQGSESIPPEKNNALVAAERYSEVFGTDGADITVHKDIPIGAGMGGSSADVAGVLVGMQRLYGAATDEQLESLAEQLGSDVKFMLKGGYARMQGRGEILTPIEGVKQPLQLLMLYPKTGVSAGACYREYDRQNPTDAPSQKTEQAIAALMEGDMETVGKCLTNDLYLPAASLCVDVKKALEELRAFAPLGAVMTGSGSAVLAVFDSEELCRYAKSRYRGKFRTAILKTIEPSKQSFLKSPFVL
jgi:4-diphosphocytidyl-2-C-methyl-D-erythritol kinase